MLTPTLTREQVTHVFKCDHAELGQLLRFKGAPLPVRVEGVALWFEDEVTAAEPRAQEHLKRMRARRGKRS